MTQHTIRAVLRKHGPMTVNDIAAELNITRSAVAASVVLMPDAYIVGWERSASGRGRWAALWTVVVPPPNVPPPEKKR